MLRKAGGPGEPRRRRALSTGDGAAVQVFESPENLKAVQMVSSTVRDTNLFKYAYGSRVTATDALLLLLNERPYLVEFKVSGLHTTHTAS